jgi:hypothetical protein
MMLCAVKSRGLCSLHKAKREDPGRTGKYENIKEWMYRWDNIQQFLDKVHHMAHQEDLWVYGILFSPLIIVEGGFIIGEEVISLTELQDLLVKYGSDLADIATKLKDGIRNLGDRAWYGPTVKYRQAVVKICDALIKRIGSIKGMERVIKALESFKNSPTRDPYQDAKKLWDFTRKIDQIRKIDF